MRDVGHTARVRRSGRRRAAPNGDRHTPRSLHRDGGRRRDNGGLCAAVRRWFPRQQIAHKQNSRGAQDREERSSFYMSRMVGRMILYKCIKDHGGRSS